MANVSDADAAIIVAAAKKIVATDMPGHNWPGRGMFAPADEKQGGVDDTVGMLLNTDGNAWNLVMILGALLGVERDVQAIRDNAAGNFPDGMYAAENEWLKARAQEFAQKLLPLCGSLSTALAPAQTGAPKKASKPKKGS